MTQQKSSASYPGQSRDETYRVDRMTKRRVEVEDAEKAQRNYTCPSGYFHRSFSPYNVARGVMKQTQTATDNDTKVAKA